MSRAGRRVMAWGFILLFRKVYNLKLMNYFSNFPFNIFRLWLAMNNCNCRRWNWWLESLFNNGEYIDRKCLFWCLEDLGFSPSSAFTNCVDWGQLFYLSLNVCFLFVKIGFTILIILVVQGSSICLRKSNHLYSAYYLLLGTILDNI